MEGKLNYFTSIDLSLLSKYLLSQWIIGMFLKRKTMPFNFLSIQNLDLTLN